MTLKASSKIRVNLSLSLWPSVGDVKSDRFPLNFILFIRREWLHLKISPLKEKRTIEPPFR